MMQQQEQAFPRLRFPEFGNDWDKKPLGSLYEFKSTNSFSRDQLNYDNGEVFNIHYGDIHKKFKTQFKLEQEKVPFINVNISLSKISDDKYCTEGDLVFADASEDYDDIGKAIEVISLNNKKTLAGLHTLLARRLNDDISVGFGGYLFGTDKVRSQIKVIAQGTKVLGISAKEMEKIHLSVSNSIEEQQKIASFLTAVDEKIAKLQKKKDLLEEYKKGCMQKLFSQTIRFTDDNGTPFPDWEERTLQDITSFIKDGTHGTHKDCADSPYLLLSAKNIENGTIKTDASDRRISEQEYKSIYKNYSLEFGDLLLTIVGTIGRAAIYRGEENIAFQRSVAFFRIDKGVSQFFYHLFSSAIMAYELKRLTVISAQPGVYLGELAKIKLCFPSPDEQKKIADFLSAIDDKIALMAEELDKAKTFKKGLLQQMFV